MYVYSNGQIIKGEKAIISPFDHGFLYGLGLFETFRIYNGHPFLLDDHLERLGHGLAAMNIEASFSRMEIHTILQELLKRNHLENASVRLNVSAGLGGDGLQIEPFRHPNVLIFPKSIQGMNIQEKEAIILALERNTPEGQERLKSHHFFNNVLAKREIGHDPNVEGIFLTKDGFLAEGIVTNLFWTVGNTLYTPALETGILNGITRQFLLKLARKMNMIIAEGLFTVDSVTKADEVFVTNSVQEIVPIRRIAEAEKPGLRGRFVSALQEQYRLYTGWAWSRNEL